jgi:HPt (histidine-containing phosphotransfer) domain-containing protein
MERLAAAEKWDGLGQLAHSLAGISGTLGAMTFADGMLLLEDATRSSDASTWVAAALAEVHATWERTRRTLRARFAELSAERKGASRRAA